MIYNPVAKLRLAATVVLTVMLGLAAAILIWGCGKKGPPEPPSGDKPPPVRDLKFSVTGNTIKLSWTIPPTTEKAKSEVAGFLIFRYQQPAHERECPNCPVIFKRTGDVPARTAGPKQTGRAPVVFSQTIEPGYRYIFKVKAYDDDGIASRDSNFVQFLF